MPNSLSIVSQRLNRDLETMDRPFRDVKNGVYTAAFVLMDRAIVLNQPDCWLLELVDDHDLINGQLLCHHTVKSRSLQPDLSDGPPSSSS